MNKVPLDVRDWMPKAMQKYIANFGFHFNKRAYEYAVSMMYKTNEHSKQKEPISAYSKQQIDDLLEKYNIQLDNKIMYDYVYVATMCKTDYLGKSIVDEEHLAKFVKDYIDDVDASPETTFRRWLATMVGNGEPIDWDEIC